MFHLQEQMQPEGEAPGYGLGCINHIKQSDFVLTWQVSVGEHLDMLKGRGNCVFCFDDFFKAQFYFLC